MEKKILEKNQGALNSTFNLIKMKRILLVEGTHSVENLTYKNHPNNPVRGINSIIRSFNRLGLIFTHVESTALIFLENIATYDLAFIYAHGEYGEDGRIQGLLDYFGIAYIGSGVLGSSICSDKLTFKRVIQNVGIPTAKFIALTRSKSNLDILRDMSNMTYPIMLKPRNGGSSIGIKKLKNQIAFESWICDNRKDLQNYFVESWIDGRFITIGLINTPEGLKYLPPLEVIYSSDFYDETSKLGVDSRSELKFMINPIFNSVTTLNSLINIAYTAFETTECSSIARIDFIVPNHGEPILLEINTIPGMAENSNLTSMFMELGYSYDEMICEIIRSSIGEIMLHPVYISQHWKKSCSSQELNGYDDEFIEFWSHRSCGIACVAMVLNSIAGVQVSIPALFEKAYKSGSYFDNKGWMHSGLASLINYYGLKSLAKSATREEIIEGLNLGYMYILSVTHSFPVDGRKGGHLVLVYGCDNHNIFFNCPSTWGEVNKSMSIDVVFSSYSGFCIEILR